MEKQKFVSDIKRSFVTFTKNLCLTKSKKALHHRGNQRVCNFEEAFSF